MGIDYGFLKEDNFNPESGVSLSARMYSALHQYFGYTSFRPLQEEIIRDVLERKDVFVLMPTGGGKSICYQLPALLMQGVTVVVSPLISLMKDQVDALEANGIAAACLNSTQNAREIRDIKAAFLANRLKILYIAPERLMMPGTFAFLKKGKVSLFAIDEAHCISEWGHDFRPEYRKLKLLRDSKNGFPDVPIIALTATATERVRQDIISQLNLGISPEKGPYIASFNRANLYYEVRPKKETFSEIADYLRKHRGESGIIYCQSRNSVENLAKKLTVAGFRALPYHAGLSDRERTRNQEAFIKDDVEIIVATIAFGMGIDKSNVRFVIHYDLPKNLESYYQETGRGGRDGSPCECILFFSRGDRFKIDYFISQKTNEKEKDISLTQLRQMVAYCEGNKCRRQTLMEYFGETLPGPCENCDSCLRPKGTFDGTDAAKKLIACVQELSQRFGTNYVIDVLTGSKNKKIKQNRHERLKSHGNGKEFTKEQWRSLASEMTNTGFLEVSGGQYPVLKLNSMSRKILNGTERLELVCPEGFVPEGVSEPEEYPGSSDNFEKVGKEKKSQASKEAFSTANTLEKIPLEEPLPANFSVKKSSATADSLKVSRSKNIVNSRKEPDLILFERLKALRKELALSKNLPPYIIFSDTTLKEMATKFPRNSEEFHSITGVGDHKLRKYGEIFLTEIKNYCRDYDLVPSNSSENSRQGENSKVGINIERIPENEAEILEINLQTPDSGNITTSANKGSLLEPLESDKKLDEINSLESGENDDLEINKISNSQASLPKKRTRYLDMSIQDWSTTDPITNTTEEGSAETDYFAGTGPIEDLPESEIPDSKNLRRNKPISRNFQEDSLEEPLEKLEKRHNELDDYEISFIETNSPEISLIETEFLKRGPSEKESTELSIFEANFLEKTYSLFIQGLAIDEIAEIQGIDTKTVFRQFEQLIFEGTVRNQDIKGLLPRKRQKEIRAALDVLEPELDSLIRARIGEDCEEEELGFVRALLLSRICFCKSQKSQEPEKDSSR